jgi:RNA polymerase sigma-70 factor (ECF subfamily)
MSSRDDCADELNWSAPTATPACRWGSADARPLGSAATRTLPLHDPERLGALLISLESRLMSVALRITRHPESARDVVQNAFEKAIRHGAKFQGQAKVSTWLHRIVANEALMWLRTQRRRGDLSAGSSETELEALADATPEPAEALDRHERARRLHDGLQRLPAAERDVLRHCTLAEESYAAYSRRTGCHPAAVKSRAFRARQRLAALLLNAPETPLPAKP